MALAIGISIHFSCNVRKAKKDDTTMKTFKDGDYASTWATIDSLHQKGLPQSAMEEVIALYKQAKNDNNAPQIIKTVIFKGNLVQQLEEDGQVVAINNLRKEIEAAPLPSKAILQSMLAEQYSNYLNRFQWQLRNRTEIADFKPEDIRTWSTANFIDESSSYYLASVKHPNLDQVNIDQYKAITSEPNNVEGLRPSLYDFLAHRALSYFINDRSFLTEPAYAFEINDDAVFAEAEKFSKQTYTSRDTSSKKLQALQLFQQLLTMHLQDEDASALVDVDLKRLKFMYDQSVAENKSQLYEAALKKLEAKYQNIPPYTQVLSNLAYLFIRKSYDGNEESEDKWNYKIANEYCEKAIAKFPKSFGANECRNVRVRIKRKELAVNTEQVNPSQQAILANIEYRNVNTLFSKVAKLSTEDAEKLENLNYDKRLSFLNKLEVTQTATYQMPDDGDFRSHTTEVKIDPLPFGKYVLMVSDSKAFTDQKHVVSILNFDVSDLFYWHRNRKNGVNELIVADRKEGNPLSGVKAEFLLRDYNSKSRKYDYKVLQTKTTNQEGIISTVLSGSSYFQVRLTKGEDVLQLQDNFSSYTRNSERNTRGVVTMFLDRAIYRPGQTVYFKGIGVKRDGKDMPSILKNEEVTVTFKDANYQDVSTKRLKTNEFGTFSGSFVTPSSGMLGSMSIATSSSKWNNMGGESFRVEEYKRPKFEVTFPAIAESFRLNDEVTIKGEAKAFAGNNIDGAKVNYRVVRETVYPYWGWWSWRRYPPQRNSVEITNGETTTDEKGVFEIKFIAQPDLSSDPKTKPQFNYKIYTDVVDITGETQSGEQNVSVGYIALDADIVTPQQINSDSLKSFKINTKNLNGNFEPASGTVVIEWLETPENVYILRRWQKPDKPLMSKAEFEKAFPQFAYEDEDQMQNWPVKNEVFRSNFDTDKSKTIEFQQGVYKSGQYKLTLKTKDKYGEEVEVIKFFKVYDLEERKVPTNEINWTVQEQKQFEPGQRVKAFQGSAFAKLNVLSSIEKNGVLSQQKWNTNSNFNSYDFPVTEKDRGGFFYHFNFVKNNRLYGGTNRVHVPWSNKDLKIEYQTFRDKLYPGQEEEWRIKITGAKKDKVAAEMVAGMYDASLDQFVKNNWNFSAFPSTNYSQLGLRGYGVSSTRSYNRADNWQLSGVSNYRTYRQLDWFNQYAYMQRGRLFKSRNMDGAASAPAPMRAESAVMEEAAEPEFVDQSVEESTVVEAPPPPPGAPVEEKDEDLGEVKVRTNLNETVFFFPELRTDADGNILIKFKMNEALTRWKFLGFAHTQDLQFGLTEKEIVTQKDLMVVPNPPRFFRENDEIEFTAKVSNLTKVGMQGTAQLQLFDALTMKPVDVLLGNDDAQIKFNAKPGQSDRLAWRLKIPKGKVMAITHRVIAKAGNFSDGEESSLPVLTNRMMVTESKPLAVRGGERKTFVFESLKNANQSSTLQHHKYTLEFTSNPAWYAVQALPYMMEYPYECTEQIFNRMYANSLATSVANSHPKVKRVFDQWKNLDTDALESNLSKNQDLKTALLEETPWVLAAQSEAEQKKNIGLLFDLNTMSAQADKAIGQLVERQLGNGGFAWFPGGRDSWYITQYLVEGMGHLNAMGVMSTGSDARLVQLSNNAVRYIDQRLVEHYEDLKKTVKRNKGKMEDDHLSSMAIHYLYARSFFPDVKAPTSQRSAGRSAKLSEATNYYLAQAKKYWLGKGIYQEGMMALALNRMGKGDNAKTIQAIMKSLKERSFNNEELGMYWKFNRGYYWYQAPIETHALMIELFSEVGKDERAVDDLKVWLLKNKQTTHWKTTKATASAVYALLMSGDNWLLEDAQVNIDIAGKGLDQSRIQKEAGTGYFKTAWTGEAVETDMSEIVVDNPNKSVAWGAAYWQYFEDLDQIKTFEETPLTLKKQLFKTVNSDTGPKLTALNENAQLSPGDKLKVRIELRVDRDMEYVHMKDMRASGFEPLNVLSSYKYQGGLGYYESTRDMATNFFFSYLPKGTYVFEYPLRVIHNGNFSNGVTTIQCMYAPEFTSHSEGIRVQVREDI